MARRRTVASARSAQTVAIFGAFQQATTEGDPYHLPPHDLSDRMQRSHHEAAPYDLRFVRASLASLVIASAGNIRAVARLLSRLGSLTAAASHFSVYVDSCVLVSPRRTDRFAWNYLPPGPTLGLLPAPPIAVDQETSRSRPGEAGWELDAPTDELLEFARSGRDANALRAVLDELLLRDPDVAVRHIATALPTTEDRASAAELVFGAAKVRTPVAPELAAALIASLKPAAVRLRDEPNAGLEPALWAALSAIGRFGLPSDVDFFSGFLRAEDRANTRQAALQALQRMFARHGPIATEALSARLDELCRKYLDADFLTNGANIALAGNAFAAAVLGSSSQHSMPLVNRVMQLSRDPLRQIAALALRDSGAPLSQRAVDARAALDARP